MSLILCPNYTIVKWATGACHPFPELCENHFHCILPPLLVIGMEFAGTLWDSQIV